jgi:formate-dependent nitrite reductase membrane component NrfD
MSNMDLSTLVNEEYKGGKKRNPLGSAHLDPRDAYHDVPILKKPVWNHQISAYFFLGGISAGSAAIGALAELFGGGKLRKLSRTAHYVSFAAFVPCPYFLIDDLGMPQRFHHMLRVFKPQSPMNLGAWIFLVHGGAATLAAMRALAGEGKLPLAGGLLRPIPGPLLAALGLPTSLALAGYTGVLLGTTSLPVWGESHLLGGLFTASSFSAGAAAVGLASAVSGSNEGSKLAPVTLSSAAAELALLVGYLATSGRAAQPYHEGLPGKLLAGSVGSTVAAFLLEALSLLLPKKLKRGVTGLASILGLAGGALLRWAVVKAGKPSATDREGTLHAMRPRREVPGWVPYAGKNNSGA